MNKSNSRRGVRALRKTGELALAVPQVIALRVARMQQATSPLSVIDRREFSKMGTEKIEAFTQAAFSMGMRAALFQQQVAWQSMTQWWTIWARWCMPWLASRAPSAGPAHFHRAMLQMVDHGLAPLHRTARANARRLGLARKR